jgi:primosomal replication protein N
VKRSSGIQKQVRRKGTVLASGWRNQPNDQRLASGVLVERTGLFFCDSQKAKQDELF